MKNNYSIKERNRIVEEHLWCVKAVMKQNDALIRAAHLDRDDVFQQLSVRLILAVDRYDPDKSELKKHIFQQLRYELLSCKKPQALYGITNAPKDMRGDSFAPFEKIDTERFADDERMAA